MYFKSVFMLYFNFTGFSVIFTKKVETFFGYNLCASETNSRERKRLSNFGKFNCSQKTFYNTNCTGKSKYQTYKSMLFK